jgi:polygalacturonase
MDTLIQKINYLLTRSSSIKHITCKIEKIMKCKLALLAILIGQSFCFFGQKTPSLPLENIKVTAPFSVPTIVIPDFRKCPNLPITDFGAVLGDKEKTSQAIAKAIDKANALGGGVVVIPAGEWLTGKIHLKSNVNLRLNKGAVLLFSENPNDYLPAVHSTWEGMECYNYSPLIYAYECKNVAITGEGEVKAQMNVWKQWFTRPKPHMESIKRLYNLASQYTPVIERQMVNDTAHLRPQFIQFNRSENILLEGITITNSPFWTIHPYLCKNVVIRKVNVYAHGHNNDGIDPEMSQNVLIEDCTFDQGDDAIAIKSGRNPEGWRLKMPSKNIIIRNCLVKNGHQLVAIGSELSGGIENVFINNCEVVDGAKLFHLLFIKTNERMGGFVKNIHMSNVKSGKVDLGILGIETDVLYQWRTLVPTIERRLTPIQDVYLTNVAAGNVKFISRILGQKELPVKNVLLKNVTATTVLEKEHIHENALNINLK